MYKCRHANYPLLLSHFTETLIFPTYFRKTLKYEISWKSVQWDPSRFSMRTDRWTFFVFSTVHHSIELFHQPTLMHNFLYSLTICLLHYYPRHVSSINLPIFRRKNCIHTASGIFALCKRLHSTLVESSASSLPIIRSLLLYIRHW